MKILEKADAFSPAFELVSHSAADAEGNCTCCHRPLADGGKTLAVKPDVKFDTSSPFNPFVKLPEALAPGIDYSIHPDSDGNLAASTARIPGEVGGFHVGLDGRIVPASIWDSKFRPACPDPRGMVFVAGCWVDIYLLPSSGAMSWPGAPIARNISWFDAVEQLAALGKQLLSAAEFAVAAKGVEEKKTAGERPEFTAHVDGLRSAAGLEQATGSMWTWGRDLNPSGPYAVLMGGFWWSSVAGPRRPDDDCGVANYSDDYIGARGRCDHLILA